MPGYKLEKSVKGKCDIKGPGYRLEQEKMVVPHTEVGKPKESLVEGNKEHGFFNVISEVLI